MTVHGNVYSEFALAINFINILVHGRPMDGKLELTLLDT